MWVFFVISKSPFLLHNLLPVQQSNLSVQWRVKQWFMWHHTCLRFFLQVHRGKVNRLIYWNQKLCLISLLEVSFNCSFLGAGCSKAVLWITQDWKDRNWWDLWDTVLPEAVNDRPLRGSYLIPYINSLYGNGCVLVYSYN